MPRSVGILQHPCCRLWNLLHSVCTITSRSCEELRGRCITALTFRGFSRFLRRRARPQEEMVWMLTGAARKRSTPSGRVPTNQSPFLSIPRVDRLGSTVESKDRICEQAVLAVHARCCGCIGVLRQTRGACNACERAKRLGGFGTSIETVVREGTSRDLSFSALSLNTQRQQVDCLPDASGLAPHVRSPDSSEPSMKERERPSAALS